MKNKLQELIWSRDLSLGQVAIKSGVNKSTITRLMNDEMANVSMETGLKICKALKVDPRDVFFV